MHTGTPIHIKTILRDCMMAGTMAPYIVLLVQKTYSNFAFPTSAISLPSASTSLLWSACQIPYKFKWPSFRLTIASEQWWCSFRATWVQYYTVGIWGSTGANSNIIRLSTHQIASMKISRLVLNKLMSCTWTTPSSRKSIISRLNRKYLEWQSTLSNNYSTSTTTIVYLLVLTALVRRKF
jgi:hypothetical protein